MRLGLFGGSFDPPHRGHVLPVQAAREKLGLDRVLYLPTARPPHKTDRRQAPAWSRFAMIELALLGEAGLFVSPFELTPGRVAYTVETLEHFRSELPDAELHLLIGGDSFLALDRWVRWREIVALARIVVLARPGFSVSDPPDGTHPEVLELLARGRAVLIEDEHVDLSSSELRRTLAEGHSPAPGQVVPGVLDYVRKYGLYSGPNPSHDDSAGNPT